MKKYAFYADYLKDYITQEHYIFTKNLEKYDWIVIPISSVDVESIKSEKCIVLCNTYDTIDISVFRCSNVFLIYKLDDLHTYKEVRANCINSANFIVGPYQYLYHSRKILKMYPRLKKKRSSLISYSAVNEFYENIEFNTDPKMKIFVSGYIGIEYPFRKYVVENLKDYIEILEHPGYEVTDKRVVTNEYYKKMNEYICCFTDASKFSYVLLKVYEICSVGSLLLVDDTVKLQLNKLGFEDNINCIMCNPKNIEEKIIWILNNKVAVDTIRRNGMILVRENHNTLKRSSDFNRDVMLL